MPDILTRFREIVNAATGPLVVIELGAHNGHHTRLMSEAVAATGKPFQFFAFEPDQRQHPALLQEAAAYGVQVIPAAVGAVDNASAEFNLSDGIQEREGEGRGQRFDGSSSLRQATAQNGVAFPEMTFLPTRVPCMRLDTFCEQVGISKIDFIWADIQGAEVDLIEGGREALARTRYLYTEYCNGEMYAGEIGLDEIRRRLPDFDLIEDYGGDVLLENREFARARPLLSILICSLDDRDLLLKRLLGRLQPQLDAAQPGTVELLIDTDAGELSIGAKRQRLLDLAAGEYICFIDDDDLVVPDYVARILAALATRPDCVGFKVECFVDQLMRSMAIHSIRYTRWAEIRDGDKRTLERCCNHLNPVRTDLARATGFPDVSWAEDRDYSERLRPLLNTEVFIDDVLYTYLYRKPQNRKGEPVHAR